VKVGHAAKTQEYRFTLLHDSITCPMVGTGDLLARCHDLQEVGIG
jgi:hypothetical protein